MSLSIEDISVVVQGPIEEGTDETLNSFEGFSDIVLSTWDNEDFSLLDTFHNPL